MALTSMKSRSLKPKSSTHMSDWGGQPDKEAYKHLAASISGAMGIEILQVCRTNHI
jgi:hypothetical protein